MSFPSHRAEGLLEGPNYAVEKFNQGTKAHIMNIIISTLQSFLKFDTAGVHVDRVKASLLLSKWHMRLENLMDKMHADGCRCDSLRDHPSGAISSFSLPSFSDLVKVAPKVLDVAMKIAPVLMASVDPGMANFRYSGAQNAIAPTPHTHGNAQKAAFVPQILNHVLSADAEAYITLHDPDADMWKSDPQLQFAVSQFSKSRAARDPILDSFSFGISLSQITDGPTPLPFGKSESTSHCIQGSTDNQLNDLILGTFTKGEDKIYLWADGTTIYWRLEKHTFPSIEYSNIVEEGLKYATEAWNKVLAPNSISFIQAHRADETNLHVVWDVSPNSGLLAQCATPQSFGPDGDGDHNLRVYKTLLDPRFRSQIANVLAHELGHLLGFRHSFALTKNGETEYKAGIVGTNDEEKSIMSYNYPQYIYLSDVIDARKAYETFSEGSTITLNGIAGNQVTFTVSRVSMGTPMP